MALMAYPPDPPLGVKRGARSFLEPVVELFDFVDDTMLLKELVLFVIEIGHQCQGSLAKAGALHE